MSERETPGRRHLATPDPLALDGQRCGCERPSIDTTSGTVGPWDVVILYCTACMTPVNAEISTEA